MVCGSVDLAPGTSIFRRSAAYGYWRVRVGVVDTEEKLATTTSRCRITGHRRQHHLCGDIETGADHLDGFQRYSEGAVSKMSLAALVYKQGLNNPLLTRRRIPSISLHYAKEAMFTHSTLATEEQELTNPHILSLAKSQHLSTEHFPSPPSNQNRHDLTASKDKPKARPHRTIDRCPPAVISRTSGSNTKLMRSEIVRPNSTSHAWDLILPTVIYREPKISTNSENINVQEPGHCGFAMIASMYRRLYVRDDSSSNALSRSGMCDL